MFYQFKIILRNLRRGGIYSVINVGGLAIGMAAAIFKIKTGYIDSDFLTMFDFPLLFGNTETALNDPNSVILTEKAAMRFFGREDPMGKTLLLENAVSMTVTGVMKDLPGNSLFQFEALVPFLLLISCLGLFALLTVGFRAVKAAITNPVKAIKTE